MWPAEAGLFWLEFGSVAADAMKKGSLGCPGTLTFKD